MKSRLRHRITTGVRTTPVLALAALFGASAVAVADPLPQPPPAETSEFAPPPETEAEPPALSPEDQAALRDALSLEPADLPAQARSSRPAPKAVLPLDWSRSEKFDGSAAITVKRPLPLIGDAKVNFGADFGLAPGGSTLPEPLSPLAQSFDNSGAAWASLGVPGWASLDARLDPTREQRRFGTTVGPSLPIGGEYSVTLQNTVALTETLPGGTTTVVPGAPLASTTPPQVWSTDRMVKFNVISTSTTLAASSTSSTVDNITHNTVSVEQKLFNALNVTTAVTDAGTKAPAKSVTAGFKLKW